MAILKYSKAKALTRKSATSTMRYVLRKDKAQDGIIGVTGIYRHREINPSNVAKTFWANKKKWDKLEGRQFKHAVISFHKDEDITPFEVYEFASDFCEKAYPGHQALIVVHQDKPELHAHIIFDSVNYLNGKKLHCDRDDLFIQRELCDQMAKDRGLSVSIKGKNFHGIDRNTDEITVWNKNKYKALKKEGMGKKASQTHVDILQLLLLILQALIRCRDIFEFIEYLNRYKWKVTWQENKKHITFENEKTKRKFRASNIQKTFEPQIKHVFGEDFVLDKEHMEKLIKTDYDHKNALYREKVDMLTNEVTIDVKDFPKAKETEKPKDQSKTWEPPEPQKTPSKSKTPPKKKAKPKAKSKDWNPSGR